jgi:hypothetical protein
MKILKPLTAEQIQIGDLITPIKDVEYVGQKADKVGEEIKVTEGNIDCFRMRAAEYSFVYVDFNEECQRLQKEDQDPDELKGIKYETKGYTLRNGSDVWLGAGKNSKGEDKFMLTTVRPMECGRKLFNRTVYSFDAIFAICELFLDHLKVSDLLEMVKIVNQKIVEKSNDQNGQS